MEAERQKLMVRKLARKDFDKVFQIMEASFPEDEYRTYQEQKALLNDPAYRIYILSDSEEDAVKAFMAVWEWNSLAFIEHFAVSPVYRNSGIGSRFLGEFLHRTSKTVCLEVEPPKSELTVRRIGFYERNRFFLNEYPYMQPAISRGRNPIPLLIMTYGGPVGREEFETIKKILYTQVYGQYYQ